MDNWQSRVKLLNPSKHISLIVLLDYLKNIALTADQNDKMPMVEIVLDGKTYLLVRESDFAERFGE